MYVSAPLANTRVNSVFQVLFRPPAAPTVAFQLPPPDDPSSPGIPLLVRLRYDRENLSSWCSRTRCRRNRQKEAPAPRSRDFHARRAFLSLFFFITSKLFSMHSAQCRTSTWGTLSSSVCLIQLALVLLSGDSNPSWTGNHDDVKMTRIWPVIAAEKVFKSFSRHFGVIFISFWDSLRLIRCKNTKCNQKTQIDSSRVNVPALKFFCIIVIRISWLDQFVHYNYERPAINIIL